MNIPQLPTNHPWYFMSKIALPNVKWCEATMFSWITEPANTWSNLAYIVVGVMIMAQTRHTKNVFLKMFGFAAVLCGLGSGLYHASYNFIFQVGDFLGMYLVFLLPLLINIERLGVKIQKPKALYAALVILFTTMTVIFYKLNIPIQSLVAVIVMGIVFTELKLFNSDKRANSYSSFKLSMAFLAVGITFSALDVTRTVCDPNNHFFQGHATWHLFTSMTTYFCYRFYAEVLGEIEVEAKAILA